MGKSFSIARGSEKVVRFFARDMFILAWRSQICNTLIVSILASCQKLPATVPDLTNRPRQLVFLTPIDSQLNHFLTKFTKSLAWSPPSWSASTRISTCTPKRKAAAAIDAQFLAGQTPDLPKLQIQLRELKLDNIDLEIGRPRTEAYIVYLFLMLRV